MTEIVSDSAGRIGRLALFLPFLLLAIVGLGWSGFWIWSKGQVEERIAEIRAIEARRGNELVCANETISGYPFRIEWRCDTLSLKHLSRSGITRVNASSALIVAQIYSPHLLIGEATAPVRIQTPRGTVALGFETARASLRLARFLPLQLSISLDKIEANIEAIGLGSVEAVTHDLGIHARRQETDGILSNNVDLAVRANGTRVNGSEKEWKSVLDATLFDVPLQAAINELFLRSWLSDKGSVGLSQAILTDGTRTFVSAGDLSASQDGLVQGAFTFGVAGDFTTTDSEPASENPNLTLIQTALGFFGREAEIAGQPGRMIDVTIKDGAVLLGNLPISQIPPL